MAAPISLMYRVVVRGVKSEHAIDNVVEAFSRLSKKPPEVIQPLLDGRKTVVMRTTDVQRASAYRRTLEMIGCVCTLEPELPPPVAADEPAFTVNFSTAAIKSQGGREFQFGQRPPLRELLLTNLRANRATLIIALALLAFLGYKLFQS